MSGSRDAPRAGGWQKSYVPEVTHYTANNHTDASPWSEIGLYVNQVGPFYGSRWFVTNVCGITNANFADGEKYTLSLVAHWLAQVYSSNGYVNTTEYFIPIPSATGGWEAWADNEALAAGAITVGLYLEPGSVGQAIECTQCTLTLDSDYTPVVAIGSEQGNDNLNRSLRTLVRGSLYYPVQHGG